MNYNLSMKLLGYYTGDNQFMKPETRFPDEAVVLAELFKKTFDATFTLDVLASIEEKQFIEDFSGNTVFILRDYDGDLYAYYPFEGKARLSGVNYSKNTIKFVPRYMGAWFTLGSKIEFLDKNTVRNRPERLVHEEVHDDYGFMDWVKGIFKK